jgi:hypothetical protein
MESGSTALRSQKLLRVGYVDEAGICRRLYLTRGKSPCLFKRKEKSAEVIVVVG